MELSLNQEMGFMALALLGSYVVAPLIATAQQAERVVYNGRTHPLLTNPLEPFLSENPDARPKHGEISTALWRGYVATWAVVDQRLILEKVEIQSPEEGDPVREDVTDEVLQQGGGVLADWYTGYLVIATGEVVKYVHLGYASLYSEYVVLQVQRGLIGGERKLRDADFVKFIRSQFEAFKTTDEYRALLDKARGSEDFVFEFASDRFPSTIYEGNPWSEPIR